MILIGAGGHARSCIDVIERLDTFSIAGLIGNYEELQLECLGYRVIATDDDLSDLAKQYRYALITVGQIGSAIVRQRLYDQALVAGFNLPTIISSNSIVSRHAVVGCCSRVPLITYLLS